MVTGKRGQQVLPGLLPPAWLQGSSQRESPLAAGQEELPLPTAWCRQEERGRANKTLPWVRVGRTRCPLALKRSALTEKFSPPHLNPLHTGKACFLQALFALVIAACCAAGPDLHPAPRSLMQPPRMKGKSADPVTFVCVTAAHGPCLTFE